MWTAPYVGGASKFSESRFLPIGLLCVFTETTHYAPKRLSTLWNKKCTQRLCFSFCADGFSRTHSAFRARKRITDSCRITVCEVRMQLMRSSSVRTSADVISGILNCVCPECGGRMGERGREFKCQGECLTDWRQAWEQSSAQFDPRSKRAARGI